jgi:hypothetical protein
MCCTSTLFLLLYMDCVTIIALFIPWLLRAFFFSTFILFSS